MAEDDIYRSKGKYERFKTDLDAFAVPPEQRKRPARGGHKYYCRNKANLAYFRKLFTHFEARDLSYVRRHRLIQTLRFICFLTDKDLRECTRDDINEIVARMHAVYASPKSKATFIQDLKHFWRILFPELDERGRPDETVVPYEVRHLSARMDKSRQKLRTDKLNWDEFEWILGYFGRDPRMQAYVSVAWESVRRPQEILYRKIGEIELHDDYAKIRISDHGKEGPGLIQCIDSFPYLLKWLEQHPLKHDKNAYIFLNLGNNNRLGQLKPERIGTMLRTACHDLGIDKPITCYSLKRNGITARRARGDPDVNTQHAAGWTSTKQLKDYDLSDQEDAFRRELEKRGLAPDSAGKVQVPRVCAFCGTRAGIGETICPQCKRPLDRTQIRAEVQERENEIGELRQIVEALTAQIASIQAVVVPQLATEIRQRRQAPVKPGASSP